MKKELRKLAEAVILEEFTEWVRGNRELIKTKIKQKLTEQAEQNKEVASGKKTQ